MKTFAALIRRYVLATAAIVLLVGGLLVGQIFYVGFKSNAVDATGYRVGALADALKQTKPACNGIGNIPRRNGCRAMPGPWCWTIMAMSSGSKTCRKS